MIGDKTPRKFRYNPKLHEEILAKLHLEESNKRLEKEICSSLELISFNAGEGAFNWVRCHCGNSCGGWIYDCGTRSGKTEIKKSLDAFEELLRTSKVPTHIIISHYHSDHMSHLKELSSIINQYNLELSKSLIFWIPRIDSYSMTLFLRLLVFSTLFKFRHHEISDKELIRLFSKSKHLAHDISKWFNVPLNQIYEVKSANSFLCPRGIDTINIKSLSPPDYPRSEYHPLQEYVDFITYILSDSKLSQKIGLLMQNMLSFAMRNNSGLYKYIDQEWGPEQNSRLENIVSDIIEELSNPQFKEKHPQSEYLDNINLKLHLWLAISMFAPNESVSRISITEDNSILSHSLRHSLLKFPKIITKATHLFNLSVEFRDSKNSFLLTGDADIFLWEEILRGCSLFQKAILVPHHGSEENVLYNSFNEIKCDTFIVSAGKFKNWKHPSTRIGIAISHGGKGSRGSLYCTNVHSNCELRNIITPCRSIGNKTIQAISVSADKVEWIIDGIRYPAEKCPNV